MSIRLELNGVRMEVDTVDEACHLVQQLGTTSTDASPASVRSRRRAAARRASTRTSQRAPRKAKRRTRARQSSVVATASAARIVDEIRKAGHEGTTVKAMAAALKMSTAGISYHLKRLVKKRRVRATGSTSNRRYFVGGDDGKDDPAPAPRLPRPIEPDPNFETAWDGSMKDRSLSSHAGGSSLMGVHHLG